MATKATIQRKLTAAQRRAEMLERVMKSIRQRVRRLPENRQRDELLTYLESVIGDQSDE